MQRRSFLALTGLAAGAAIGGWALARTLGGSRQIRVDPPTYPFDPLRPEHFRQPLFIPSGEGPFGVLEVADPLTVTTRLAALPLLDGKSAPFMVYETSHQGKAYQNPILRMESGARLRVSLRNALQEPTIIHWHGLHTSGKMDGHPASTIDPGAGYEYEFSVGNRGGTYWYHTHAHELTAEQAYGGLASFFLVEDDDQRRLNEALDLRLGETDVPLVIQDKQFDDAGHLYYAPSMHDQMAGWLGDIILANLTPNAVLSVTPRLYRFRLLNGSNSR